MDNIENELDNNFFKYKILTYPDVLDKMVKDESVNPINLEINLTNICNHKCIWCTYGYLHSSTDTLDKVDVKNVLDDAYKMGVKSITWTGGGEPLVHKDFYEIIEYAAKYKFKQGLNTNGVLLNDKIIECLAKNFSYVRFSVDSGSSECTKRCHQTSENDFDKIINNIKKLCNAKKQYETNIVIGYSFLIDQSNVNDMITATQIAKDANVDYIQFKPIVNYYKSNSQFSSKSAIWEKIKENFSKIRLIEDDKFKIRILEHKFSNIKLQNENFGRKYDKCYGCDLLASIGANGSVDLCCAYKGLKQWSLGNIKEEKFIDIWNGKKRQDVKRDIEIKKCPPMCKADEINRLVDFIKKFDANKEFI